MSEKLLESTVGKLEPFYGRQCPASPTEGLTFYKISRDGFYEERGLKLDRSDLPLSQLYAGLAVLTREMYMRLADVPSEQAAWLKEIVSSVNADEQSIYRLEAFPYVDHGFSNVERERQRQALPPIIQVDDEASLLLFVEKLGEEDICHEWTAKPGVRLFYKFLEKFDQQLQPVICGNGGPHELLKTNPQNTIYATTLIGTAILSSVPGGVAVAPFWYILAGYIAILLVKKGLEIYCKRQTSTNP